jgi:hypothetical protein
LGPSVCQPSSAITGKVVAETTCEIDDPISYKTHDRDKSPWSLFQSSSNNEGGINHQQPKSALVARSELRASTLTQANDVPMGPEHAAQMHVSSQVAADVGFNSETGFYPTSVASGKDGCSTVADI